MDRIRLTIPAGTPHTAQIITGFLMLREQGWEVELTDRSREKAAPFSGLPVLLAEYRGKRLLYDAWDGYQDLPDMLLGLENSDFYFKRSFSPEKNHTFFPEAAHRMYPLGFNYHVTCPGNPAEEPGWKAAARLLRGKTPARYFVPEVFEGSAEEGSGTSPKILFLAGLWGRENRLGDDPANSEREAVSTMRIEIIRAMRSAFGDAFLGGVNDCALSRKLAPELIVPRSLTERRHYLKVMHGCDICIGSTGLHGSIGWKTGEYVAAAKAIVQEKMNYSVPGDFREGVNYLSFRTPEECVKAVAELLESPQRIQAMKRANAAYYQRCLRPDMLVKNTLRVVDAALDL